jgi:NitT/TauT family transport system substrate-binding protein
MRLRTVAAACVLSGLLTGACGGAGRPGAQGGAGASQASRATTHVEVGILGALQDAPILVAEQAGYFKAEGLDVRLERLNSGANMVPQLAEGQLDAGIGAVSAGMVNAELKHVTIRIVADGEDLRAGWSPSAFVARKQLVESGRLKSYKDLKGLTVAFSGNGSTTQINVAKALARGGLTLKDVNAKVMGFPEMVAALSNGSVDVADETEPFVAEGVQKGVFVRWRGVSAVYPGHDMSDLMYSPAFMQKDPEAAKRFMVAFLKGVRTYEDAFGPQKKDRAQVVAWINRYLKIPDVSVYDKVSPPWFNPNGYVNIQSLQQDADWWHANGFVGSPVQMKSFVDNRFVDYALQKLGKVKGS